MSTKIKNPPSYFLYILECSNNSLYTGIAVDPQKRYQAHCAGTAAKYTRAFPPVKMVALWEVGSDRGLAQKLECKIKKLKRSEKIKLIQLNPERLVL